jgi:hypothetical protein
LESTALFSYVIEIIDAVWLTVKKVWNWVRLIRCSEGKTVLKNIILPMAESNTPASGIMAMGAVYKASCQQNSLKSQLVMQSRQ